MVHILLAIFLIITSIWLAILIIRDLIEIRHYYKLEADLEIYKQIEDHFQEIDDEINTHYILEQKRIYKIEK